MHSTYYPHVFSRVEPIYGKEVMVTLLNMSKGAGLASSLVFLMSYLRVEPSLIDCLYLQVLECQHK